MGICFVGKVGIKEFLQQYVKTETGDVIDQSGKTIGRHDGAIFYTIGQRHGLDIGGGFPYYVTGKDMKTNTVYVTSQIDDDSLWKDTLRLTDLHWINEPPEIGKLYMARTRYRAPLVKAQFKEKVTELILNDPVRAVTPGQSVVIYENERVVGGGIII
jgi:tRNA-specific 2-thiouridylase